MKLKLILMLIVTGLMFNVGCTSSNDGDTDVADMESSDPALDMEGSAEDVISDNDDISYEEDLAEDEVVSSEGSEDLPADSLDAGDSEEVIASEDDFGTAGQELADGSISSEPEMTDVVETDVVETDVVETDVVETDVVASDSMYTDTSDTSLTDNYSSDSSYSSDASYADSTAAKPVVSLKKIKDVPYTSAGVLVNTVYMAREGDTWKLVSEKIYGTSDKANELKAVNPYLAYRELKISDKIYYNSPKRPQDSERMLTYYEDNGIPAQTYVARAGDNIRDISKNLLGHSNSWKEVWSTNLAVESKWDLQEGTELRYWPEGSSVATAPAPVETIAEPVAPPAPTQAATDIIEDDFALPDEMNDPMAAGTVAAVEPPPPPPPAPKVEKSVASKDAMADKDMTFMLAAGGLLLAGIGIILSIVKKNRARKISMNTHTQI